MTINKHMLADLGVDEQTQARLALFQDTPAPEGDNVWQDPTPVTLTLTAGQVTKLRACLRSTVSAAIHAYEHAYAAAILMGADFKQAAEESMDGLDEVSHPSVALPEYLDVEDVLSQAWAEAKGTVDFTVPDTLPDDWGFPA